MGISSAISRLIDRKLSGGTLEDYQTWEQETAADFELLHDDPELETCLPHSGLGHPLATWSFRAGPGGKALSASTQWRKPSDRALHEAVLRPTGRRWVDVSIAVTCRLAPDHDLGRCVQATRYRGADERALRRALSPAATAERELGGLKAESVDRVRIWSTPRLQTETQGFRLVRGDVVFEIGTWDEAWLADAADQLANGWRAPAPTFEVDLPDGWVALPASAANFARLAEVVRPARPDFADWLVSASATIATAGATLLGTRADIPGRFSVAEFPSWQAPFEDEMQDWQRTWAQDLGTVDLEYVEVPAGPAARLAFQFGEADHPAFGQPYIVRAGDRSYQFDFMTDLARRDLDAPDFEAIVRSMRVTSA